MSSLSGMSVVSSGFVAGLAIVTVIALAATVALLSWPRRRRRRPRHKHVKGSAGSARRWRLLMVALTAVLVCQLLDTGLATAKINATLRFANTLGQVAELASGSGRDSGTTQLAPVPSPDATREATE